MAEGPGLGKLLGSYSKEEAIAETFINLTVSRLPSCLICSGDEGVQPGAAVLIPGEMSGSSRLQS